MSKSSGDDKGSRQRGVLEFEHIAEENSGATAEEEEVQENHTPGDRTMSDINFDSYPAIPALSLYLSRSVHTSGGHHRIQIILNSLEQSKNQQYLCIKTYLLKSVFFDVFNCLSDKSSNHLTDISLRQSMSREVDDSRLEKHPILAKDRNSKESASTSERKNSSEDSKTGKWKPKSYDKNSDPQKPKGQAPAGGRMVEEDFEISPLSCCEDMPLACFGVCCPSILFANVVRRVFDEFKGASGITHNCQSFSLFSSSSISPSQ